MNRQLVEFGLPDANAIVMPLVAVAVAGAASDEIAAKCLGVAFPARTRQAPPSGGAGGASARIAILAVVAGLQHEDRHSI